MVDIITQGSYWQKVSLSPPMITIYFTPLESELFFSFFQETTKATCIFFYETIQLSHKTDID